MIVIPEKENDYVEYVRLNATDPYSREIVIVGEMFGSAIDEGKTFDEAEEIFHGKGLTGFMVGAIISAMVNFHPRGEEIKTWWNIKMGGTGEEKGSINPAIITLDVAEPKPENCKETHYDWGMCKCGNVGKDYQNK